MPLPYTHQHYPKHRHRLKSDATIESREVRNYGDELAQTPETQGWVDLARDLFETQAAMRVALNIETTVPDAPKETSRARSGRSSGRRSGHVPSD